MTYKIATAPASEPVTASEAKTWCSISGSDHDTLITAMIIAARESAENIMRRAIITQTWDLYLDKFPDVIQIGMPPVTSISYVKYYDTDGTLQTLNASLYTTDLVSEPARITPAYNQSWPSIRNMVNAVNVRFVTGYANAAAVPEPIKSWIKQRVATLFENREAFISGTIVNDLKHDYVNGLLDRYITGLYT